MTIAYLADGGVRWVDDDPERRVWMIRVYDDPPRLGLLWGELAVGPGRKVACREITLYREYLVYPHDWSGPLRGDWRFGDKPSFVAHGPRVERVLVEADAPWYDRWKPRYLTDDQRELAEVMRDVYLTGERSADDVRRAGVGQGLTDGQVDVLVLEWGPQRRS